MRKAWFIGGDTINNVKVITISGHAQNGKDTTAKILKEILEDGGYKVLITHYADLLKYICRAFFDWDGNKDEEGRTLLQYVGTDVVRNNEPDFWVNFIVKILKLFDGNWDYVLIPDCRFPNECNVLRENGFETILLKVIRSGFESPLTEEQRKHPSETAMDNTDADYTVDNSGSLDELKEKLNRFVEEYLNGIL